ncbi:uncharacterized protein LOC131890869 [Tigriopus californicus]|uniref:uncharacterized protein LOC131890869 n=1 Tax=Tigriopus californicus TaxID=6832 RepID=UPI0027D9D2F9|nr:uncharacterized protein LOC131890869 [Tigriopus californicus]
MLRSAMKRVHDLTALRDTLAKEMPFSIQALESVKHQTTFKLEPAKPCYVSEDEKSSLVVIKEASSDACPMYTIYCNQPDVAKVERDLKDFINWNEPWGFGGVPSYLAPTLKKMALANGPEEHLEIMDCWVFILDPDVVLPEVEIPSKYKIQQVPPCDAKYMDDLWKYKSGPSLDLLVAQTKVGLGFGAYADGELASSTAVFNFGALGGTGTAEKHRRNGLSQMIHVFASKHLRSLGLIPFGFVESYNIPSRKMMEKLKFSQTHDGAWLFWKRPK